jgi:DNA repair photolyase
LLAEIARANVFHASITITTLDEELARLIEPRAPRPCLRLDAVRGLAAADIAVGVFPNPIMPLLTDSEEGLEALAAGAAKAGASFLGGGLLFLKPSSRDVFFPFLEERFPKLLPHYRALFRSAAFLRGDYAEIIKARVRRIRARHGLGASPVEYTPEGWPPEPRQGELFELEPCQRELRVRESCISSPNASRAPAEMIQVMRIR